MESTIAQAEDRLGACRQAADDPSIVSDAEALRARHAELEAAQAEVDQLYARWAELEAKRNQTIGAGPTGL
jgi:ATP-binding cassette subfamily F protein uup